MTIEEAIKIINDCMCLDGCIAIKQGEMERAGEKAIKALKAVDGIIDILFDDAEGAEGELICRKLLKYGFLKLNNEGDYEVEE